MTQPRSDVLQGTLDLMVLKTLDTLGSMHGYGIAQRIQQVSNDVLSLNQGRSIRPCCVSSSAAGSPRAGACPTTTGRRSTTR